VFTQFVVDSDHAQLRRPGLARMEMMMRMMVVDEHDDHRAYLDHWLVSNSVFQR